MCGQRPQGPSDRTSMQQVARPSRGRPRRMAVPVAVCFRAAVLVITAPTLLAAADKEDTFSTELGRAGAKKALISPFRVANMASALAAGNPPETSASSATTEMEAGNLTSDAASSGSSDLATIVDPAEMKNQVEQAVTSMIDGTAPCSCDCCQVVERAPGEVVTLNSSVSITHKCDFLEAPQDSVDFSSQCPNTCKDEEENAVVSTDQDHTMDSRRFCTYHCRPISKTIGGDCVMLTAAEEQAAMTEGGNGQSLELPAASLEDLIASANQTSNASAVLAAGQSAQAASGEATQTRAQEVERQAAASAEAEAVKVKVVYDMRKLLAERMRAETGASMAHGSSASERVRVNQYLIARAAALTKKSAGNAAPMQAGIEDGKGSAEASATNAKEAENEATRASAEAESFVGPALKEARKLAKEEIEKKAAPCAKVQAEDLAIAKGLDKPDKWEKVLAARAADPYMQAVSVAVQRVSEYKAFADNLVDQASAAQMSANKITPHMNALEATGDVLGAKIERVKIRNLLARSRTLQSEAKKYWKMADDTRKTVPQWQTAAGQAAQYAAWEFKNPPK